MMEIKNYKELKKIIRLSQNGDRKAQNELYEYFYQRMVKVCFPFCRTKEDLEDTLMSGFGKLFSHLNDFNGKSSGEIYNWVKTIFRNQAMDDQARRNRKTPKYSVAVNENSVDTITSENPVYTIDLNTVYESIGTKLPDKMSEAITLCAIDGLSCREAADLMGISEVNLRVLVFRARNILSEIHPEYSRKNKKFGKDD